MRRRISRRVWLGILRRLWVEVLLRAPHPPLWGHPLHQRWRGNTWPFSTKWRRWCAAPDEATFPSPHSGEGGAKRRKRPLLLLHKRPLKHILPRRPDARRCREPASVQQLTEILQHRRLLLRAGSHLQPEQELFQG